MCHCHHHTGSCNHTDYFEQNRQNLRIEVQDYIFGLNKISTKLLVSFQDQRNWEESVIREPEKQYWKHCNTKLFSFSFSFNKIHETKNQNMKQYEYKSERSELYMKSTVNRTTIAGATTNPQNITSSIYLYIKISWRSTQL